MSGLVFGILVSAVALSGTWGAGQQTGNRTQQRAKPPTFEEGEFDGIFFQDLYREALVGPRPDRVGGNVAASPGRRPDAREDARPDGARPGGFAWSRLVSAVTLEDEVKSIKLMVDQDVTTPAKFSGQGYQACRRHFSILATAFAIIGQYDGDVRWKNDAPAVRDRFARAAANCKVGSQQAYNEAKLRKQDLQDLVGGSTSPGGDADPTAEWGQVVDRGPLMQRLEAAMRGRLQPWTANKSEFSANSEDALHEAEIVAAISEVLVKDGMEDAGDDEYDRHAKMMQQAALEIVEAVKSGNQPNAGRAVGEINKSCSACHETYRG